MTEKILTQTVLVAEEDYAIDLSDWDKLSNEERVHAQLDANNRDVTMIFVQTWYVKENEYPLQAELNELLGRSYHIRDELETFVPESMLAWADYIGKGPQHIGDN